MIDDESLQVARERCKLYQLNVELIMSNGDAVVKPFEGRKFDAIIYMAVIEHILA